MEDKDELIKQLKERIDSLEKQNAMLDGKVRLYESPSPARAYYVSQKILNQQVDYLDKFNIETEINVNPKEDKVYDRAIAIFERMPDNAKTINNLKIDLGLSGDQKKDTERKPFNDRIAESRV
jgi:hypothetical protein